MYEETLKLVIDYTDSDSVPGHYEKEFTGYVGKFINGFWPAAMSSTSWGGSIHISGVPSMETVTITHEVQYKGAPFTDVSPAGVTFFGTDPDGSRWGDVMLDVIPPTDDPGFSFDACKWKVIFSDSSGVLGWAQVENGTDISYG